MSCVVPAPAAAASWGFLVLMKGLMSMISLAIHVAAYRVVADVA